MGYQEGERGRTGIGPATHQHGRHLQARLSEQSTKHHHPDLAIRCLVHVAAGSHVNPIEADEDASNKQEIDEMGGGFGRMCPSAWIEGEINESSG